MACGTLLTRSAQERFTTEEMRFLAAPWPLHGGVGPEDPAGTLWTIDLATDQPPREITRLRGAPTVLDDWPPATPDNTAQAQDTSIPVGDTKVASAFPRGERPRSSGSRRSI